MTECRSPEYQDLLPDLVAATLSDVESAAVTAHLRTCVPCREDADLLRRARALPAPPYVTIDVARIVAALPKPVLTLHREPVPAAARRPNRWSASVWQVAAALGAMVVGGASLVVTRRMPGTVVASRSGAAQLAEVAESALARAPLPSGGRVSLPESVASRAPAVAGVPGGRVSVSYGDLGDYSAAELQRMLDRLEEWDGASSTEPLPALPVVSTPGGTSR
ncbi:MAG: zf-HC2 domain-containing protein [Gemmatimonadota bacterium]|nr:zf-HC2 domain-containing protein [Gemmatimonadota bacterium]